MRTGGPQRHLYEQESGKYFLVSPWNSSGLTCRSPWTGETLPCPDDWPGRAAGGPALSSAPLYVHSARLRPTGSSFASRVALLNPRPSFRGGCEPALLFILPVHGLMRGTCDRRSSTCF
eukprot:GHVT01090086.1.p3 GENE.GHVT01090086.1~~GHVT01090086.1.p3  ORF type:complete len:119 (-),score=21.15 GHVT01090086.1:415-771(-)